MPSTSEIQGPFYAFDTSYIDAFYSSLVKTDKEPRNPMTINKIKTTLAEKHILSDAVLEALLSKTVYYFENILEILKNYPESSSNSGTKTQVSLLGSLYCEIKEYMKGKTLAILALHNGDYSPGYIDRVAKNAEMIHNLKTDLEQTYSGYDFKLPALNTLLRNAKYLACADADYDIKALDKETADFNTFYKNPSKPRDTKPQLGFATDSVNDEFLSNLKRESKYTIIRDLVSRRMPQMPLFPQEQQSYVSKLNSQFHKLSKIGSINTIVSNVSACSKMYCRKCKMNKRCSDAFSTPFCYKYCGADPDIVDSLSQLGRGV